MRRRPFRVFLVLLALLAAAGIAAKFYLASRARPELVARLEAALGMHVQIASADVGLSGGSEIQDVQIFESKPAPPDGASNSQPAEKPWFRVDRIEADVSVLGLLSGSTNPHTIHLYGASVTLRFDKDDNLLTRLPSSSTSKTILPELILDGGKLTLEQEGRPPLVVEGIQGKLTPAAKGLTLAGTVTDPRWGKWKIGGTADPSTSGFTLTLDTAKADVTAEKLKSLPFISRAVWQQVMAEGTTPVHLTLGLSAVSTGSFHYKVELEPTATRVHVSSIDLDADNASGKVVIEDKLVTLASVTGRTAGGTIAVNGTLDFRPEPSALNLDVGVQNVEVRRLPRSWDLPEALDGKLTGKARVRLRLTEPVIQTDGSSGEGTVTGVSVLGLGNGSAQLFLHPGPGRIRFRPDPPPRKVALPVVPAELALLTLPPDAPQPEERASVASHALDRVAQGLGLLTKTLTDASGAAVRRLHEINKPRPPGKEPTYFEANLSLQDVDLAELVRRSKLVLPFAIAGRLSFQLNVGFPVDSPRDFKSYRFQGDARLSSLKIAGLEMANVRTRVRYANGILVLESLSGETPVPGAAPGTFEGTARYQVIPAGDLSALLRVQRLPAGVLFGLASGTGGAEGTLSGNLQFRAPGGRLDDPATWEGAAELRSDTLRASGLTLKGLSAIATLTRGTVSVNDLKGDLEGAAITGSGKLKLGAAYPFEASLAAPGIDLTFVQRVDPAFRPPVRIQGRVDFTTKLSGTLRPLAISASGTARGEDLLVESVRVSPLSFQYSLAADRVKLNDITAGLYGGTVVGSATLPLFASSGGGVSLRVSDVDARALSRDLPSLPVRLEGRVSGTASAKVTAATPARQRETTASVELSAPNLRVQGIPTDRVRASVTLQAGTGSYRLEGDVAGGTFKLEGELTPPSDAAPKGPSPAPGMSNAGTLRLRGVQLGRLVEALFPRRGYSPLRGTLDADLPFRFAGTDRLPTARGTFAVSGVRWGDATLADRLQGQIRSEADGIYLSEVSASIGGGDFHLSAGYRFVRGGRVYLNVDLFHVDVASLLAPFPQMAGLAEGPADLSIRLSGDGELRGSGRAVISRGRLLGAEVADWRVPVDFSFVPGVGGQLDVRDSSAQIAQGRAQGRVTVNWGDSARVEGNLRFFEADLHNLIGRDSQVSGYADGRLTGTLDFSSDDFRSADDLTANLAATLSQARASSLPVLEQAIPFLGLVGGGSATRFERGEVRGRLARGVFRVQRFSLTSSVMQLMLEGDVTLAGRINLEVTAGSGGAGVNSRGIQLLGVRLPALGPLPLALLVDATAFLANRIVHLRITGTLRDPIVRVEPTNLLSEEAIRFFLGRSGLPVTP
jgi:translocation and assembly module TamB